MRKSIVILFAAAGMMACNNETKTESMENPFYSTYETPHGVPPFHLIKEEHYMPAFKKGFEEGKAEIDAIVSNTEAPTFENTIEAMAQGGKLLNQVASVFYNLKSANTNPELEKIAKEVAPLMSAYGDDITLNADLFAKVKEVYETADRSALTTEQNTLLEDTYKGFVRGGANLEEAKKEELRKINSELSLLSLEFGSHLLAETNSYAMVIDNEEDLAGLPEGVVAGAAAAAKERDMEGKWVFTLHKPSFIPFLQYSEKRELRKEILMAYATRANHDNENDNKEAINKLVNLRVQRAQLLGYENHASYILENNMSKTPENTMELLNKVWTAALPKAQKEAADLQEMIKADGQDFELKAWDWWYYAEKLKQKKYSLSDEEIKPYFSLDNVREGIFTVVNKLYGLKFVKNDEIPVYHEDATGYEVYENDGTFVGVLYMDFHPRASKRAGAWMTSYRKQSNENGNFVTPVISIVCNFTPPTGDTPSLLTFDEVSTFFHEFGHALHGLLSKCEYDQLSGTAVSRDFVELPSQIMERWAAEPKVLNMYARNYKTGKIIPAELLEKMEKAGTFNQGFVTVEYMSAALLDMAYHTQTEVKDRDINAFETETLNNIGLMDEIIVRYRSSYFSHIFSGGYSAGYYAYIWSEVLDADAFESFKQNGLFDPATAKSFRENILEKGGSEDPMKLYKAFKGAEPSTEPLLMARGLK